MAFAYVPPPPEDDFLDPLLFSSQQQNSRLDMQQLSGLIKIHSYLGHFYSYAHDHSNLGFAQPRHKSQAQYFGGDGFVDTSAPSKSLHFFFFCTLSTADTPR